VKTRIISDAEKANDLGSDLKQFEENGIAVKLIRVVSHSDPHAGGHMHHKFAIFDGNRLINGSYNWTRGAADQNQENLDGEVLPIVVNNNNFAKGDPTLLSFDDARTLFHEFGHGLHGLLSKVRYPSQSGTSVRRDFVEFPSQVFEHWLEVPETLRRYARHCRTGEPLPEPLLQRLLAARTFNQGFATVEYAACALLDLDLHVVVEYDGSTGETLWGPRLLASVSPPYVKTIVGPFDEVIVSATWIGPESWRPASSRTASARSATRIGERISSE
jgi:hypothetical protein